MCFDGKNDGSQFKAENRKPINDPIVSNGEPRPGTGAALTSGGTERRGREEEEAEPQSQDQVPPHP